MRCRDWSRACLGHKTEMDSSGLFWTKLAAIGQVAGAIATFAAVWVALYLAQSERSFRLRVTAKFQRIVSVGGSIRVMSIQVENVGLRTAVINGFGWTTGYANTLRILPKAFRLRSAFQLPDYEWSVNPPFPWKLEPGQSRSTHIKRENFIEAFSKPAKNDLFRRFPWQRAPKLFRHRVYVSVDTRETVYPGVVDRKVTQTLNQTYQGDNPL